MLSPDDRVIFAAALIYVGLKSDTRSSAAAIDIALNFERVLADRRAVAAKGEDDKQTS